MNDDRTTLLRNEYNREILRTLADIFVGLLPQLRTEADPAAHLDYMPARGRGQEGHGFGDDNLSSHVLRLAGAGAVIPNANAVLCNAAAIRPLDLTVRFEEAVHQGWIVSPNTGDDVPHWRCYSTPTRATDGHVTN